MRICLDTVDNVKLSIHNDEDWKAEVTEAMAGTDNSWSQVKLNEYYGERFQDYAEHIYSNESALQQKRRRG